MKRSAMFRACWFLLIGLGASAGPAWASPYTITRLDGDGRFLTNGQAQLNNRGQVAANWHRIGPRLPSAATEHQPYFYDPTAGGKVTLPAVVSPSGGDPGGYDSRYVGGSFASLNDAGRAVVAANGGVEIFDASTGRFASTDARAGVMTNSGEIFATKTEWLAGGMWNYLPVAHDGRERQLALPPGATGAVIESANEVGDVLVQAAMSLGGVYDRSFVARADGAWTDLGSAVGAAINDHGVVAGHMGLDAQRYQSGAALIAPDGVVTDLGALPGDAHAAASAINNRGEVVGFSYSGGAGTPSRGFLYEDGRMTDLDNLLDPASPWSIRSAWAINDLGQILARGIRDGDERESTLLLTPGDLPAPPDPIFPEMPIPPVPEPSTLLVFAGLALGVGIVRRGRRA